MAERDDSGDALHVQINGLFEGRVEANGRRAVNYDRRLKQLFHAKRKV